MTLNDFNEGLRGGTTLLENGERKRHWVAHELKKQANALRGTAKNRKARQLDALVSELEVGGFITKSLKDDLKKEIDAVRLRLFGTTEENDEYHAPTSA